MISQHRNQSRNMALESSRKKGQYLPSSRERSLITLSHHQPAKIGLFMTHIMHDAAYAGNSPGTPHDSRINDKPVFSWSQVKEARADKDNLKTMMVMAAMPIRCLGPFPLLLPQEALTHFTPSLESQGTARTRSRCLTSPAPALRTALIKDMMAVFRFTSSRYRPKLRSSSFSSVQMEKHNRKDKEGSRSYSASLCTFAPANSKYPECPYSFSLPNLSNLIWDIS